MTKRVSVLLISIILLLTCSVMSAQAESIPSWIKNSAEWWADGIISDNEFTQSLKWLIEKNIILVDSITEEYTESNIIPSWIKNSAGWWADGTISDNEFLNSVKFLIENGIIQIKTEQSELQILLQKRENLIDFIWKEDGFPTHFPDSIEENIFDRNFDDLKNLKKIDMITVEMKHNANSISYLLHPKEQSHEDLIIYHNGHGDDLHADKKQIRFLLDRGYTILVFSMPTWGLNEGPIITLNDEIIEEIRTIDKKYGMTSMLDGKEMELVSHEQFKVLESDEFSPISYFVEPIAVALNHVDKNFDYSKYHMIGISGGGWTSVIYPAIDPRISHSFSVAGSHPVDSLNKDYEQRLSELYQIADYNDLYVLASFGEDRKLFQSFNLKDQCCFAAEDLNFDYEEKISNRLTNLGSGEFDIHVASTQYHFISAQSLITFYLDIDEKNKEYYQNVEQRMQTRDLFGLNFKDHAFKDNTNVDLVGSNLHYVNISNTTFTNNHLFSSWLVQADFTNTDISNSDISYSIVCNPKIENTVIHNVDFTSSIIDTADFTKSNLKNAKFDMSSCHNCIFDNLDPSEIKISKNLISYTNFAGSSFKNVDFRNWEHGTIDFSPKMIQGCMSDHLSTSFHTTPPTDLTGANFSGHDLKNIVFTRSTYDSIILNNVDFSFADLSFHNLINAKLKGANLSNANLTGVDFTNADLEGASLSGANLKDTILDCHNHIICNT